MIFWGIVFLIDGLCLTVASLYFWQISKNWMGVMYFACIGTGLVMLILLIFGCKSPKWLYTNGYVDEANEVLTLVGRTNGVLGKDEKFEKLTAITLE